MKTSPVLALSALVLVLPLLAGCSSGGATGGASGGSAGSGTGSSSSGASGSSGSSGGSASNKQCLLSATDASTYVDTTVTETETSGSCSYTGDGVSFVTTLTVHSSAAKYAADVKQLKDDVGSGVVAIDGVGDKAQGVLVPKDTLIGLDGSMEVVVTGADGQSATRMDVSEAIANALFAEALLQHVN